MNFSDKKKPTKPTKKPKILPSTYTVQKTSNPTEKPKKKKEK